MSRYRRVIGNTFFFTVVSYRRRPILCDERVRSALRRSILLVRSRRPLEIDAWVLLPDHIHTIWTLPEDDSDFSQRWSEIKRYVSLSCRSEFYVLGLQSPSQRARRESTIWQRRFWEHRIRDEADFAKHFDYVHFNPVKHRHASRVGEWPYSTFHRHVRDGVYPNDWCGSAEALDLDLE